MRRAVDEVLAGPELAELAGHVAATPEAWEHRVRHDPQRRFYERLVATDTYDAWLIGWSPGHAIPAHDHGASAGAIALTHGRLTETTWPGATGTPRTRVLQAGEDPRVFGPAHVHAVANLHREPATSIHLYSPPLSVMRWLGDGERTARDQPVIDRDSHRRSVDRLLADARARLERVGPADAALAAHDGALLVDIRPDANRRVEGSLPGAVVVERNELEWRLDPTSAHRLVQVVDHDTPIVVVCNEGYASSLAAATLRDLGLRHATDLDGGFRAWKRAGLAVEPAGPT